MDRTDWMYLRAGLPAAVVLAGGIGLAILMKQFEVSPYLVGIAPLAPWVFVGSLVAAGLLAVAPYYRLWRWEQGEGLLCPSCEGPLGALIDGRYGPYHRCQRCRRNVAADKIHR